MPTTRVAALLLTGAFLLTACTTAVTGAPVPVPRPTRPKPPPTFTLLATAQDDEIVQRTVKGIEQYAGETKGKLTRVPLNGLVAEDKSKVSTALARKPSVVIALRVNPQIMVQQIQARPDQQFLLVDDACGMYRGKNVTCLEFRDHEGAYLLGVEAGLLSPTGRLGAVVAMDLPIFKRFYGPMGPGAAAVKPGATMNPVFLQGANQFQDPVAAEAAAKQLGATHVMALAFGGNKGVYKAAKEGGFSTFGIEINDCPNSEGTMADSVIKRTDVAVVEGLKAIAGNAGGTTKSYGLKEKGVTLVSLEPEAAQSQCTVVGKQEVLDKVKEIREKIVKGELQVADPSIR